MDIKNIQKLIKTSYKETLQELNILNSHLHIKIEKEKEKEKIIKDINYLEKRIKDLLY